MNRFFLQAWFNCSINFTIFTTETFFYVCRFRKVLVYVSLIKNFIISYTLNSRKIEDDVLSFRFFCFLDSMKLKSTDWLTGDTSGNHLSSASNEKKMSIFFFFVHVKQNCIDGFYYLIWILMIWVKYIEAWYFRLLPNVPSMLFLYLLIFF